VLGHEIGHVQQKHHIKVIQKQKMMSLGTLVLSTQIKGEKMIQKLIGSGAESEAELIKVLKGLTIVGLDDPSAWFDVNTAVPAAYSERAAAEGISVHEYLTRLAAQQSPGEHGLLALDWHSGNRSVLVDHDLSGLVLGLTLTTRPEDVYRALLESTAFGTRRIIESFREGGVGIDEVVVAGGLLKNTFLMQVYADVTDLPLSTIVSEQGAALGSAIHAAVAAGGHPDIHAAAAAMGRRREGVYQPVPANVAAYDELYREYLELHDYFGRGGNDVMHRLKSLRRRAAARRGSRAADGGAA